jgi:hypothetical protein
MSTTIVNSFIHNIPNPSDAANPAAWWKFNDKSTLNSGIISPDDPISTVDDKFGLGRDLEQLTGGSKPIYKVSHASFLGGKTMDVVNTEISKMPAWTVYIICTPDGTGKVALGDGMLATTTVGMAMSTIPGPKFRHFYADDTNFKLTDGSTLFVNEDQVYVNGRFSTGSGPLVTQQVNGVDEIETNGGGTATSISGVKGTFVVGNRGGGGSSTDWNSDIAEIIIYSSEHSDLDRNNISLYLAHEYPLIGISL